MQVEVSEAASLLAHSGATRHPAAAQIRSLVASNPGTGCTSQVKSLTLLLLVCRRTGKKAASSTVRGSVVHLETAAAAAASTQKLPSYSAAQPLAARTQSQEL